MLSILPPWRKGMRFQASCSCWHTGFVALSSCSIELSFCIYCGYENPVSTSRPPTSNEIRASKRSLYFGSVFCSVSSCAQTLFGTDHCCPANSNCMAKRCCKRYPSRSSFRDLAYPVYYAWLHLSRIVLQCETSRLCIATKHSWISIEIMAVPVPKFCASTSKHLAWTQSTFTLA